ncbi:hypothetical protein [Aquabacter sediminis]|uniref:hypothetical protein n=1 Tax=Aquabacter sediminis TaxID=3029197 RepID=UPI00237EBEEB|nr:hypothetical protein [Aquabacter sp. P-9]MDE1566878.1 hypothetical protein [Aquabacter sp. P-9]
MATVKSYELAAYMTMVHKTIAKKAQQLHGAALATRPAAQLISGYSPMRGKVDQPEVVAFAVLLAELYSKKEKGIGLNEAEALIYGPPGNTLVDAIDNVREALQSRVVYDTSLKATLDYLENVTAAKAAADALTRRMKGELKRPNPWAVTLLDVLFAASLQAVPFVGPILSAAVKDGIVSAAVNALGGGDQADARQAAQADQDIGTQIAGNVVGDVADHVGARVSASADHEDADDDIRLKWFATGLNATFIYTLIQQSRERSEKKSLRVISDDVEFMREFAGRDTNRWLGMSQNPQTANELVARFSNRGASNGAVQQAASRVGTEFKRTLRQDGATLEAYSNSIASKLSEFRNLVDAFLCMSVSLALVDSIDKFKIQAANRDISPKKFGLLQKSNQISATDENISALLIISYYFISEIKNSSRLERLRHTQGGEPFAKAVHAQRVAVEERKQVLQKTESLANAARDIDQRIQQQQAVVRDAAEKLKGLGRFDALRVMPAIKAQQDKLAALHMDKAAADKAATDLRTLAENRLKTFQVLNSANPDAPANKFKMQGLGSDTEFSWRPSTLQARNYVEQLKRATMQDIGAIFPNPSSRGFEEAIKAVLASSVIVSNVHAQSARGETISINNGAVAALGEPGLDFVHFYTKFLGVATSNDKRRAIGQWSDGAVTHRLRWPKESTLSAKASIAETATMYSFAATVVAYVDLAEVAMGVTTWSTYRQFLNSVIREINDKAIDLKNQDKSAYDRARARAEEAHKQNKAAVQATLAQAAAAQTKTQNTNTEKKNVSTIYQDQLIRNRKI